MCYLFLFFKIKKYYNNGFCKYKFIRIYNYYRKYDNFFEYKKVKK